MVMRKLLLWLAIGVFWCLASVVKAAPIAVSQAWFDWDRLQIQTISFGSQPLTITWNTNDEDVWVSAYEEYQSDSAPDWTTPLNVSAAWGGASASAAMDSQKMEVYSASGMGSDNPAHAFAGRYGEFTVSGTGVVVFSLPYHVEVTLSDAPEGTNANAGVDAWLYLGTNDEIRNTRSDAGLWKSLVVDGPGSWSDDGILVVALYFNDGEGGYFEAGLDSDTYASSPVPLPSALFLLGGGLLGVAGCRKLKV